MVNLGQLPIYDSYIHEFIEFMLLTKASRESGSFYQYSNNNVHQLV